MPDSALVVLEQMDVSELSGKEEYAKYALLYSMALDKNLIDKTDFDALQPAIDYYKDNGTVTDKLRALYYQGRIYENKGEEDKAMQCFIEALSKGTESDDVLTKSRILYTQGRIYSTIFEWEKCLKAYDEAGKLFLELGKTDSYVNCIACMINVYTITGDVKQAEHYITLGLDYVANCSMRIKGYFYSNYLTFIASHKADNINVIKVTINKYQDLTDSAYVDWLSVSNAYLSIAEPDLAMDALSHHKKIINVQQQIKYYALLADIYQQKKEYKEAFDAYQCYVQLTDSLEFVKSKTDLDFIEEKHSLVLKNIQEKEKNYRIVFFSIVSVVGILVLLLIVRYRLKVKTLEFKLVKQEKERYRLLYHQIVQERDKLTEVLECNKELDEVAKNALLERVSLLNRFFTTYITDNRDISRKVDREIEKLIANKEVFISSTRLAFTGSHPKFIKHLEECGLNEWEINYCCLYALGLKGKEVGEYIQLKSHFNNSSEIRKKLGLGGHDVNLGTYIRTLLQEE